MGLQTFHGDVVQVLRAHGVGIELVPRGGHGLEWAQVSLSVLRVENHQVGLVDGDALEQGEVGVSAFRLLVDIVHGHFLAIALHHAVDAVGRGITCKLRILGHGLGAGLQVHLAQRQLLDFLAVVVALDGVARGHGGIVGFHGDVFRGVDGC